MRRRDLILAANAALGLPLTARAQQKAMPVVGYLNARAASDFAPVGGRPVAFLRGLGEAGFIEGQNVAIEYRWAENHQERLPTLADDLVSRSVAVIATFGGTPSALAARRATSTIPIVFFGVADPVGLGLVASLSRPGGNITGFSNIVNDLTPKRLELLSEIVPTAGLIALLVNPNNASTDLLITSMQEAARTKGIRLLIRKASSENEIEEAFSALAEQRAGGLVVQGETYFENRRDQIVALSAQHAVPAIFTVRPFALAGGLISYGIDDAAGVRTVGVYVGKLLKGAKPADLPVEQPSKFELVINLKTAKALGLTVPQAILARADEVIE